jgi:hypothetical protein
MANPGPIRRIDMSIQDVREYEKLVREIIPE